MATWLPEDFAHPLRVDLPTGHHLRPARADDVDVDYPAVMGSRERLWTKYGEAWGWPPAHMTHQQDRDDLQHHEDEIAAHVSFLYMVFPEAEDELLGCVYVDPSKTHDATVSWWVVAKEAGGPLQRALDAFVPRWLAETWRFERVDYSP